MLLKRLIRCVLVLLLLSPIATNVAGARGENVSKSLRPAMLAGERESLGKNRRDDARDVRYEESERDDDDSGDHDESDARARRNLPKAKLSIRNLSRDRDALNWIRLDARRSRGRRSGIESYQFEIRDLLRGAHIHSPGASKRSAANVLLSPGRYEVALKVTDSKGKSNVKIRKFKIPGRPQPSFDPARVQWAFGTKWRIGEPSNMVATPGGPISYGDITKLFAASSPSDSNGFIPVGDTSTNGGTTTGCGSILTSTSDDYKIASGTLSFIPGAGPLFGVSGQIMGMYGSKKASACVQAQISEINEQLAYQESQIQQIDNYLALGEFDFYEVYVKENQEFTLNESNQYYSKQNMMADGCTGDYITFLTDALMWDEATCDAVLDVDLPKLARTTVPFVCDDGNQDSCDPIDAMACGGTPAFCIASPSFTSPFENLKSFTAANSNVTIVTDLAGTDPTAISDNCTGEGATDCWKQVAPPSETADSTLLALYNALWVQAVGLVQQQMAEPQLLDPGNVVPSVYEAYNQSLASFYQRSLTVLNQAFFMEYVINQFNYYHAHDDQGARNGNYIQDQNIFSWGKVPGTLYEYGSTPFESAQDDAAQYNKAQEQLALLYAARVNQLYLNTLNWVISDEPVGPQSYPDPPSSQAAEWPFAGNLQVAIPFDSVVGASLATSTAAYLTPAWDTPIGQVLAQSTSSEEADWTSNSILYQFSMQNPYKCNEALAKYNAEQAGQGSSGFLASALGTPADCPPIFALPDGSPLNQSFFDGKTLQPYSYSVSAGGTDACPDECQTCTSGLTYTCGGEAGTPACDPTGPDSCSTPSSCLPVTGGGLGLAIEIPDSWQVTTSGLGSNGSWSKSCDTDGAVISGAANSLSDPPRLCASCNPVTGAALWSCATCPSGMWAANTDGTLTCVDPTYACRGFCSTSTDECGDYRFAKLESTTANRCTQCGGGPVLALSAPMPSNLFLCASPAQLAFFEVPYSYSGNNAGLIPGTAVLSCGSWKDPETFSATSPTVPVADDDSVLASVWETPELYSTRNGTEWDCGTGAVQFQPSIPCVIDGKAFLNPTEGPSNGTCDYVGLEQVGVNTNESAVLNFRFMPPNELTGSTEGGASIALSLVFQCSACQSQSQDMFGRNQPINNFMYGCTNLIAGPPSGAGSSDQAAEIALQGYACELTSQIGDERTTPQTLSCSSVDGREYLLGLVYSDSSTDSGLSSGVSLVSKQANLGCPSACYQCASGAGGATPGGRDLVTGTDGDFVCDGYCSGWNYCGDSNYNLANETTPPVDCTSCGAGDFVLDEPTICAASDFDTCACDGTVYYGKKFLNSLDTNGNAQPGGGADLSGDITTFSEMISDASHASTTSGGLIRCAPSSFGVDPAIGSYKHCYCSSN